VEERRTAAASHDALADTVDEERRAAAATQRALEARVAELDTQIAALKAEVAAVPAAVPVAAPARDPELAQHLAIALGRIRDLELQLFERERGPADNDQELGAMLPAAAAVSDQAGKRARRYEFKPPRKIRLDRTPCLLMDLSVTGAQIISATSPDVGHIVTLTLPSGDEPCFCQGRILWARREQTAKDRPYRYRAGIVFTAADERAIEAFVAEHGVA
jgi:hypothetical protein